MTTIDSFWQLTTPKSEARGDLKENVQNPDSGSKNSENQNNNTLQ